MDVSYSSWTHHRRILWHNSTLYLIPFGFTCPTQNIVPQSHHFYNSFFSQSLLAAHFGMVCLQMKRNETKRFRLPAHRSLTYVWIYICTYVCIAIFSFANQTQLPSCPLLLEPNDDLEKVGRFWRGERGHPRIYSGERRAHILVSLRGSSWARPPRGPSLIGCHKPRWRYLLQTELPPPGMPWPNSIVQTPILLSNDLICSFATHTHTHTNTVTS